MLDPTTAFLLKAAAVSLSGVLAPGPVTAATLAAGARNPRAGTWIAIGHGIVEFPLMGLIMAGVGAVLTAATFRIAVGLAGGAALLVMAGLMLKSLDQHAELPRHAQVANPIWTGIVLTGGNPYFLFWWATVGLALATEAVGLGAIAFGLFALIHWLCDLLWLQTLSWASHKGISLFGPASQRVVIVCCSAVMGCFGAWFVFDATRNLWR